MRLLRKIDRLLSRFLGVSLDDSAFGRIRLVGDNIWRCTQVIPSLGPVTVDIFADKNGPDDRQRAIFLELRERLESLRSAMAVALLGEYLSIRADERSQRDLTVPGATEDFKSDFPEIDRPEDVWNVSKLCRVEVYGSKQVDFVFDHMISWADDHQLNVAVKDWRVVEVMKEG